MKVLICENGNFAKMCAELFEKENIEVITVDRNIEKITDILKTEHFDVVILNALVVNEMIVAEAKKRNAKIVALSDYDLPEIKQKMSEYDIDDFVLKPFGFEELLWRVRKLT